MHHTHTSYAARQLLLPCINHHEFARITWNHAKLVSANDNDEHGIVKRAPSVSQMTRSRSRMAATAIGWFSPNYVCRFFDCCHLLRSPSPKCRLYIVIMADSPITYRDHPTERYWILFPSIDECLLSWHNPFTSSHSILRFSKVIVWQKRDNRIRSIDSPYSTSCGSSAHGTHQ